MSSNNNIKDDLEKAFHWYQKMSENGHVEVMFDLVLCYCNGKGIEKNLEKAFYWFQKATESGYVEAMFYLADHYYSEDGTEKNLEKAFYWYQKAAESGHVKSMNNLASLYNSGEGSEKDLEKAFHWYQKAAESGLVDAMFSLASHYNSGKGTEKNFEKAFYWYQKAAESGHVNAMNNLASLYNSGKWVEKDLKKAFYWYQKAAEGDLEKVFYWCQKAAESGLVEDFSKWTSKNKLIDKFIQEAQLSAKNNYEVLEWISYNKLLNINYYSKGGFSKIYKASWSDGPIDSWNFDKQQWNRWNFQTGYEVILKTLNNLSTLEDNFLNEWKYHYNCQEKSFSKFIQIFGITQDPYNFNYIIVMSYARKGNLRKCLSDIIKFKWQDKLQLLKKIILGLKVIHKSDLTHNDLHDGNILISDNYELFIIDLGLCKPINNLQDFDKKANDIYGVVPYMAPEILRMKPCTQASDIYSFSMIMWEFTSGIPPFNDKAHDHQLIYDICKGKRPEIIRNTPKCYVDLMEKCWDSDPSNRPTITELEYEISE
ncbi:hypothetical protein RclHR1_04700007 [Rhizophagus clarus]|uniref:Protein kinase domain-containing protein n=1 Tax=Rhizophagus clarus TaxID=94130 RepID=A0A2Z6RW68_9GLOM|nr:hypothetical protein RclHR1_04700007 [Rhizophagus clarus]